MVPHGLPRSRPGFGQVVLRRLGLVVALVAGIGLGIGALVAAPDEGVPPTPKEIKKQVRRAVLGGDDAALAQVLRKVGTIPGREATEAVLSTARSLPTELSDAYWLILDGVASFRHGDAFTEMASYILRHRTEAVSWDLLNALRRSDSKFLGRVIRQVMEHGSKKQKLAVVDLAPNAKVRRTVDILLPYLIDEHAKEDGEKNPPTPLKQRIIYALEALTLQRFGNSIPNWSGWWAKNRERGLRVLRAEAEDEGGSTGLAQDIDPVRQAQLLGLEKMPPGKVLVIKGGTDKRGNSQNYDHIERVLERIKIPHDVVIRAKVAEKEFKLDQYAAVLINCCQINEYCQNPDHRGGEFTGDRLHRCLGESNHDLVCFAFKEPARKKIRKWVENGGYLFTEDWVLMDLLALEWAKYVGPGSASGGDWYHIAEQQVKIRPSRGFTAHPFLRGVFVPPPDTDWTYDPDELDLEDEDDIEDYDPTVEDDPGDVDLERGRTGVVKPEGEGTESIPEPDIELVRHEWKIDNESPSIEVRSKKVEVLVISETLDDECGDPAVAITFAAKKGRVFHVLSHFGRQSSSHNEATIENMLVNFLIEVNVRVEQGL